MPKATPLPGWPITCLQQRQAPPPGGVWGPDPVWGPRTSACTGEQGLLPGLSSIRAPHRPGQSPSSRWWHLHMPYQPGVSEELRQSLRTLPACECLWSSRLFSVQGKSTSHQFSPTCFGRVSMKQAMVTAVLRASHPTSTFSGASRKTQETHQEWAFWWEARLNTDTTLLRTTAHPTKAGAKLEGTTFSWPTASEFRPPWYQHYRSGGLQTTLLCPVDGGTLALAVGQLGHLAKTWS